MFTYKGNIEIKAQIRGFGGITKHRPQRQIPKWKKCCITLGIWPGNKREELSFEGQNKFPRFLFWYFRGYNVHFYVSKTVDIDEDWVINKIQPENGDIIVFPNKMRYLISNGKHFLTCS